MDAIRCITTWEAMMNKSRKRRIIVRIRPLRENELVRSSNLVLKGDWGSCIWEGRYERNDGTSVLRR